MMGKCNSDFYASVDDALTIVPESGRKYTTYLITIKVFHSNMLQFNWLQKKKIFCVDSSNFKARSAAP